MRPPAPTLLLAFLVLTACRQPDHPCPTCERILDLSAIEATCGAHDLHVRSHPMIPDDLAANHPAPRHGSVCSIFADGIPTLELALWDFASDTDARAFLARDRLTADRLDHGEISLQGIADPNPIGNDSLFASLDLPNRTVTLVEALRGHLGLKLALTTAADDPKPLCPAWL